MTAAEDIPTDPPAGPLFGKGVVEAALPIIGRLKFCDDAMRRRFNAIADFQADQKKRLNPPPENTT